MSYFLYNEIISDQIKSETIAFDTKKKMQAVGPLFTQIFKNSFKIQITYMCSYL